MAMRPATRNKDSICISTNCTVGKLKSLGLLLTQIPASSRSQFLNSLDFANGKLVIANMGSVKSRLKQAEFEGLFNSLGSFSRRTPKDDGRNPCQTVKSIQTP
jgi:hypothetical protein